MKLGKRFRCERCGLVAMCIKASEAESWECCGEPMQEQPAKQLPSSD